MHNSPDVARLVEQAKRGNGGAMKSLYDMYVLNLLTTSKRITGSLQDAEDIIQESFIAAFNKLDKLKDPSKFKPWVKQIVVNNSLLFIRHKVNWKDLPDEQFPIEESDDLWYQGISLEHINKAIDGLSNGARQIFTLYLLEGYKHKEIAELLDIATSTSKSQYRYALRQLKKDLSKYIEQ